MKLYYSPGACSLGIHVLLEEIGAPYEVERISVREGEHLTPQYQARNPKTKVPLLERGDGSTLTEYGAISQYLATDTVLAPVGREAVARGNEAMDYIVGTIHMQGFARVFRTANFTPNAGDEDWVKRRGRDIVGKGYGLIAETLGAREYLLSDFTHVDCALFYVEHWARRGGVDLPAALAAEGVG